MLHTIRVALVVLAWAFTGPVLQTASAQNTTSEKIELAERQTALAHKLVRAICFAENDIQPQRHLQIARQIRDTLDATLLGMIEGNAELGLTPETDGTTLTLLSSVQKVWNPLRKKVDAYLSGAPHSAKDVTKLSFKSDSLEKLWTNLIRRYELKSTVSGGVDNLQLARLINTASHQRSLVQQAGKLGCLVSLNNGPENAKYQITQLEAILPELHLNTFALAFTHPDVDLTPPPNEAIENSAFRNWQNWSDVSDIFDVFRHGSGSKTELLDLSYGVDLLSLSFENVMQLYTDL